MDLPPVLVVGCGIAGPVLALFLQAKGYRPIVFEKVGKLGDAGASLMLMPNGMKVFSLLGLDDAIYKSTTPLERYEDCDHTGHVLGSSLVPSQFTERYGYAAAGVRRTNLNLMLRDILVSKGIEVREGWGLDDFEEHDHSVTANFGNGRSVTGCLLIGSDGIKARSRQVLLSKKGISESQPSYTGLSQTAGISPTPVALQGPPSMRNVYGDGMHIISYPISSSHTSWAITARTNVETKETWRLYDAGQLLQLKEEYKTLLKGYDPAVLDLVVSAERITRYGLFDRPGLEPREWYSDRCVLVGDAAHPTSPHLGQGANQALEDCYHLNRLLPPASGIASGEGIQAAFRDAFKAYAELRQPRTSLLVKGARAQGEKRVTSGAEACKKRNQDLAESWNDAEAVGARFDALLKDHPFPSVPQ